MIKNIHFIDIFKKLDISNRMLLLNALVLAFLSAISDYFILKIISGDINIHNKVNIFFLLLIPLIKFLYLRKIHVTPSLIISNLNEKIFRSYLINQETYKALFKKLQISIGQEMDNIESLFFKSIIEITYAFTSLILVLIAALTLIKKDSLSGIIMLMIFYIFCNIFSKRYINKASKKATNNLAEIDRLITYSSYGRDLINIHRVEEKVIQKFFQLDKNRRLIMAKLNIIGQLPRQILELLICLSIIIYIFLDNNLLSTNSVLGLSFAGFKLLSCFQSIFACNTNIRFGEQIFIEKFKLLRNFKSKTSIKTKDTSEINQLSKNDKEISNFLTIFYGDRLFIKGKSGSGKTRLLKNIAFKVKNNESKINYNFIKFDFKIKNFKISFCPQDNLLIKGNIMEQISFFGESLNENKLKECLEICFLNKLITEKSFLNKDVNILSGGEQRRLILALTLYKDADLYIFDEPSSGIEKNTFLNILENIKLALKDKIIIFTTHEEWGLNWYTKKIDLD